MHYSLPAIAATLLIHSASAAVITSVTYVDDANAFDTNPEPDRQTLSTFRIGTTDYFAHGATPSNVTGSSAGMVAATNDEPISSIASLTGLTVTYGVTNLQRVDFDLGITVNDDSIPLFFGELGIGGQASDALTINPFINGVLDLSWSIDITTTDYSYNSNDIDTWSTDENVDLHTELASFVLSDFTGGTGTLTDVTGFRLTDPDTASMDIVLAGYGNLVPEPSTALLGVLGSVLLLRRRR